MVSFDPLKERLTVIQERKHAEREQRIDRLVESARDRGEDEDRIFWSIVHDLEEAPATTNRHQLEEVGYRVPTLEEVGEMSVGALDEALWNLIEVLAIFKVYLCRTDHLGDRALIECLVSRIIEEPIPELPLSLGVRDWIDLAEAAPEAQDAKEPDRGEKAPSRRDHRLPRP